MSAPRRENNPARRPNLPGFQDTPAAFESLIKSGEAIIAKHKDRAPSINVNEAADKQRAIEKHNENKGNWRAGLQDTVMSAAEREDRGKEALRRAGEL